MKISGSPPIYINNPYSSQANQAGAPAVQARNGRQAEETKTDNIDFSEKTLDMQKISQAMETAPADRQKKISHIKQQVATDQYTIDALQVAEKMIGSILDEPV